MTNLLPVNAQMWAEEGFLVAVTDGRVYNLIASLRRRGGIPVAVANSLMIVHARIASPFAFIRETIGVALTSPTAAQLCPRVFAEGSRLVLDSGSRAR